MYLDDLLTIISDLHPSLEFFYQTSKSGPSYPISKIQGDQCLLFTGKKAKTIAQIMQLLGKLKSAHIPVYVYLNNSNKKAKVFGVQINLEKGQAYTL